jgi:uncharacterized protein YxjI
MDFVKKPFKKMGQMVSGDHGGEEKPKEKPKHKYDVQPQPLKGELCVFGKEYVVPEGKPLFLAMKNKISWTGDDYIIKDAATQEVWFKIDGKLSFCEKKTMFDRNGAPVFIMKEKVMQLDDVQTVYSGKDPTRLMFEVKSNIGNSKQRAKVTAEGGREVEIVSKCSLTDSHCAMWLGEPKEGGHPIACFKCKGDIMNFCPNGLNDGGYVCDYYVEIAPGVDAAMVVAIVMAQCQMNESYW